MSFHPELYITDHFNLRLKGIIPRNYHPRILSITYHSPGFIELGLVIGVALALERIVRSVARSAETISRTYTAIMEDVTDRSLLRLRARREELELEAEELKIVERYARLMAEGLDINTIEQINRRTGHPYRSLTLCSRSTNEPRGSQNIRTKEK